ncbi:Uncharacterised protein [Vibrio cholerae]|nr:Uncharacterised protein [Vibrio cholerae]
MKPPHGFCTYRQSRSVYLPVYGQLLEAALPSNGLRYRFLPCAYLTRLKRRCLLLEICFLRDPFVHLFKMVKPQW